MNRWKRVLPLAATLLVSSFSGQALALPVGTYVWSGITGLEYGSVNSIIGVLANDTAVTTTSLSGALLPVCQDYAFAMISHPGTYTLTLVVTDSGFGPGVTTCRLDRNP